MANEVERDWMTHFSQCGQCNCSTGRASFIHAFRERANEIEGLKNAQAELLAQAQSDAQRRAIEEHFAPYFLPTPERERILAEVQAQERERAAIAAEHIHPGQSWLANLFAQMRGEAPSAPKVRVQVERPALPQPSEIVEVAERELTHV